MAWWSMPADTGNWHGGAASHACDMISDLPAGGRVTVGADKAYDTAAFVARMRELGVTPHVAQTSTRIAAPTSTRAPRGTKATGRAR